MSKKVEVTAIEASLNALKERIHSHNHRADMLETEARQKKQDAYNQRQIAIGLTAGIADLEALLGNAIEVVEPNAAFAASPKNTPPPKAAIRYRKEGPTTDILNMIIDQPGIERRAVNLAMAAKKIKPDTSKKLIDRMIENQDVIENDGKLTVTDSGIAIWQQSPLSLI